MINWSDKVRNQNGVTLIMFVLKLPRSDLFVHRTPVRSLYLVKKPEKPKFEVFGSKTARRSRIWASLWLEGLEFGRFSRTCISDLNTNSCGLCKNRHFNSNSNSLLCLHCKLDQMDANVRPCIRWMYTGCFYYAFFFLTQIWTEATVV